MITIGMWIMSTSILLGSSVIAFSLYLWRRNGERSPVYESCVAEAGTTPCALLHTM
jgi:hypothetical protein